MALLSAGHVVELREIKLGNKPQEFLAASASATVPTLQTGTMTLDESLHIMTWALTRNDPENLLDMPEQAWHLIDRNDGPFKAALDHTKYAVRYPELDPLQERAKAADVILDLDHRLQQHGFLMGARATLADLAIVPFVRQFALIDRSWFDAQPWPNVLCWLDHFLQSARFHQAMVKVPLWSPQSSPIYFGPLAE